MGKAPDATVDGKENEADRLQIEAQEIEAVDHSDSENHSEVIIVGMEEQLHEKVFRRLRETGKKEEEYLRKMRKRRLEDEAEYARKVENRKAKEHEYWRSVNKKRNAEEEERKADDEERKAEEERLRNADSDDLVMVIYPAARSSAHPARTQLDWLLLRLKGNALYIARICMYSVCAYMFY